jgi:hypothetical protein
MYLIKTCPSCKTRLRFPIDKGTIMVKCPCGFSFVANPDDTDIYKEAAFDLSRSTCGLKKMTPLKRAMDGIKLDQFIPVIINRSLNIKYKIQNFRLLPEAEKKKIIFAFLITCAIIAGMIVTLYMLTHGSDSSGKIII